MKSYKKELIFNTGKRIEFINITEEVQKAVEESGVKEGLCLINAMHITASVFINDDEKGLHRDFEKWLEKLAPHQPVAQYQHNVCEDNADAHM
ncbi:MAG: secondary thiamine-phosphate synthase enzyme YjbQ, partial [Candidatus Omnitrophica bacterium]|nr:secondary thiamine-phosphate synthase enzyme YjbQ [Candidatus Omnitrophota bacterium]